MRPSHFAGGVEVGGSEDGGSKEAVEADTEGYP